MNMLSTPNYTFQYLDSYKYLTNICLNVTDDCNLQCRYCFVEQQPHYMTYKVAKDATDWIYSNLIKKRELGYCTDQEKGSINFFGGEPTLMWDSIIVPLTQYIKTNYKNDITLGITTNGTLLNENRIIFLKENNIGVLLSIDGGPNTQNWNRPCKNPQINSFDLVEKNIPTLLKAFPSTTFRATVLQSSVNTMFESYLYAEKLGFKKMFQIPNEREQWSDENILILQDEIKKICYYHLQHFLNNSIPQVNYELLIRAFEYIKWIDENGCLNHPMCSGDRGCDRCGLGTNYGSISYDGTIYGCQEQDSRSTSSLFRLGNIYNGGIDSDRQKILLEKYSKAGLITCEDPTLCQNCKLRSRCFDDCCPSTSFDLFSCFNKKSKVNCIFYQTLIDNALTLMKILVPQNNYAFKEYLKFIYTRYQRNGVHTNGS